jgi:glycosyltransferase involved in cell wall biosynthesis
MQGLIRSLEVCSQDLAGLSVDVDNSFASCSSPVLGAVSVIIPTLNEAGNLPYVLNTIPSWVREVIVVDGRSDDDTQRIAKVLRPDVRIVHEIKRGKGAAMKAGLYAGTSEYLIALDADGSMDGAEIGAFRDALVAGADYVKGSRFCAGAGSSDITPFRRFGDASICVLLRVLFGARYSDATYGYIGIRADRLDALSLDSDGFEVETLIGIRARRARLRTAEVPCYEAHRIHGASNLRAFHDGLRIFRTIVGERLRRYRVRAS